MIPWFQYTVVYIGPIPIQVWGFFVALGMVVSILLLRNMAKQQGLRPELFLDYAVWMIIGGIIGARLFHIVFYEPMFFLSNPIEVFKIWHGGLSSFGGLTGAAVAFYVYRRWKDTQKLPLLQMTDILSFAAIYGWIVGRIGCFMIHDHLGKPCNCFLAINGPDQPRLDMALVEIISLLPLAVLFLFLRKKQLSHGVFTGILFVYYGVLRFILDFYRAIDIAAADARYFGLTPGQYFAILLSVFGLWLLRKKK